MESDDKRVVLGKISTVYGVKGWLKVNSYTSPRKNIFNYPQWLLKTRNGWIKQDIEQGRPHGKTLVVKLAGCEDRDQAQLLVGSTVAVFRSQLPETESGEHYWLDILGMDVVNTDGQELGQVKDIMETGSNDVLVVERVDKEAVNKKGLGKATEILIPWLIDDVIINVNTDKKLITVHWDTDYLSSK